MNTKPKTETINQKCLNTWTVASEELLKTIHFYGRDWRAAQNSDFELMFPTRQRVVANIEWQDVLRRICNKCAPIGSPHIVFRLEKPSKFLLGNR